MTASELKYLYEQNDSGYFFTRKTMKFFGDTMRNYGVRACIVAMWDGTTQNALELYRRRAVKHGLNSSHYFTEQGKQLHPKEQVTA